MMMQWQFCLLQSTESRLLGAHKLFRTVVNFLRLQKYAPRHVEPHAQLVNNFYSNFWKFTKLLKFLWVVSRPVPGCCFTLWRFVRHTRNLWENWETYFKIAGFRLCKPLSENQVQQYFRDVFLDFLKNPMSDSQNFIEWKKDPQT